MDTTSLIELYVNDISTLLQLYIYICSKTGQIINKEVSQHYTVATDFVILFMILVKRINMDNLSLLQFSMWCLSSYKHSSLICHMILWNYKHLYCTESCLEEIGM